MSAPSLVLRLIDIIEAIERIRGETAGMTLDAFEADWRKRGLVERGVEIISEASRHLTDELKSRHPEIPWPKVAGIGTCCGTNMSASRRTWSVARDDLPPLEKVCREELTAERSRERE